MSRFTTPNPKLCSLDLGEKVAQTIALKISERPQPHLKAYERACLNRIPILYC